MKRFLLKVLGFVMFPIIFLVVSALALLYSVLVAISMFFAVVYVFFVKRECVNVEIKGNKTGKTYVTSN